MIKFTLSYEGNDADDHEIDFYDVGQALIGFQRSLAITTHLVLNGEVITKALALKNARIIALPPEEGSWKVLATIAFLSTSSCSILTIPKDTPLGHLVYSAYDYVISETMGFHVDYEQSLGQQYEALKKEENKTIPIIEQSQLDSVIEKCEYAIGEMHRPIVKSETAKKARILYNINDRDIPFKASLTYQSYEYIRHTNQSNTPEKISGKISSYNINTFKGRIFVPDEARPIPFMLSDEVKKPSCIERIMGNMTQNARDRFKRGHNSGEIFFTVFKNTSRSGRLKSYYVLEIE